MSWQKWRLKHFKGNDFSSIERRVWVLSWIIYVRLAESGEATLYKWAKFLSMLNIILTSQQSEQQLQRTNRNEIQMVDNLTPRLGVDTPYLRAFLHTSGFSHVMRPRACLHGVTMPKRAWRINNERLCRNLLYVIVTIALSQHAHPYNWHKHEHRTLYNL